MPLIPKTSALTNHVHGAYTQHGAVALVGFDLRDLRNVLANLNAGAITPGTPFARLRAAIVRELDARAPRTTDRRGAR